MKNYRGVFQGVRQVLNPRSHVEALNLGTVPPRFDDVRLIFGTKNIK